MSLTLRTLTPLAAAARSLARTASISWPRLDRRRLATRRATTTVTRSTNHPNNGLGSPPPRPWKDAFEPKFQPNREGAGTYDPVTPPPQVALPNQKASIATAAAKV